jgi:hypothetical protein
VAVPNEGTNELPSDNKGRFMVGLFDRVNNVFKALSSDQQGNLLVSEAGVAEGILGSRTSVGTGATAIPTATLTRRKTIVVYNTTGSTCYLGNASVTTSTGFPLDAGKSVSLNLAAGVALYGICASGSATIATLEGA